MKARTALKWAIDRAASAVVYAQAERAGNGVLHRRKVKEAREALAALCPVAPAKDVRIVRAISLAEVGRALQMSDAWELCPPKSRASAAAVYILRRLIGVNLLGAGPSKVLIDLETGYRLVITMEPTK